ncbi:MAG TPA: glycosyltransferase [Ktedonobacteraceae bacterium]|jgi:D-inositol-3-phosphate glycosyltransferase|nr:glycosyltransferase [Ktedonobacteraceae bacterium]
MSYSVAMLSVHTSPLDTPGKTKDAGGMNVYMRELAYELALQHQKIDIFTRWTNEHTPQIVQVAPGLRVIHIQAGPKTAVAKQDLYQYLPAFVRNLEEFVRREEGSYDLLHSHYWLSGVAAMELAARWDVPHVTMFHTLGKLKQQANPREPESPLRLEMEQRVIQQADVIVAATAEERMQMIRGCGASSHRVEVVPCGVNLQLFQPYDAPQHARERFGLHADLPILLFAGRLDPFKGPDLLLHAASLMQEDAQVVIAGGSLAGDNDLYHLQQLADELKISERVKFLGACPQPELPLLFSAADITVVPSYHESFGLVAVESLACGTPVVATRAGGLTTVVRHGETGFLVPRCPGFFAERLDTLLRDPHLYAQMCAASRHSVLQYSWMSVAAEISAIYDLLVTSASCLVAQ